MNYYNLLMTKIKKLIIQKKPMNKISKPIIICNKLRIY